jgi:hypothetical protein
LASRELSKEQKWEEQLDFPMSAWLELHLRDFEDLKTVILNFYASFPQYTGEQLTEGLLETFGLYHLGSTWYKEYTKKHGKQKETKQKPKVVESEIEAKVSEITKGIEDLGFLPKSEQEKIGDLKHHRMVLKEIYENYMRIKGSDKAESSKQKYLEQLSKELLIIQGLEETEKGVQSLLEEVWKAEDSETAEQFRDYLEGYTLQVLCRKAGTPEQAIKQLEILEKNSKILQELLKEQPSLEEAIKTYLSTLYEGEVKS